MPQKPSTAPKLLDTPAADRPRERLLSHGPAGLRTADLLAMLIRIGRPGESALQAADKIAAHFADNLDRLADAAQRELAEITPVVGPATYCTIMAGIELGRRIAQARHDNTNKKYSFDNSAAAVAFCRETFSRLATDAPKEEFHIVCLDTRLKLISTHRISVGVLDRSLVHPREVFRPAVKDAAKAIILVHNHPSGDPTPSDEDVALTRRLEEAGKTMGIDVLDHIIVARSGTISLREWPNRRS
jgi:DNA repair protein RadC